MNIGLLSCKWPSKTVKYFCFRSPIPGSSAGINIQMITLLLIGIFMVLYETTVLDNFTLADLGLIKKEDAQTDVSSTDTSSTR